MKLLSIDPGQSGGLALFQYDDKLALIKTIDTPYDKKEKSYKYRDIYAFLVEWKPDLVVLEHTLAIASSGTSTAKQIGIGEGMWLCLFSLLQIEYIYSYPAVWTKQLGLKNDKTLTIGANKKTHIDLASRLYPDFKSNFTGPKGGSKDGVADAVLIGEAWYRKHKSEVLNVH